MHKEFLQRLEIEFEETLIGVYGFDQKKLRKQIEVFEILKKLDVAIGIYVSFF